MNEKHIQCIPFEYLQNIEPNIIVNYIENEHPQAIALILSYIDATKAASIMDLLSIEIQSDVTKRIAKKRKTRPEVVREVERVLEKRLSTIASDIFVSSGGIEHACQLLKATNNNTRQDIIDCLEEEDPELAEEINKQIIVFEDIIMLSDEKVKLIIKQFNNSIWGTVLNQVDEEVLDKILRNTGWIQRRRIKQKIKECQFSNSIIAFHRNKIVQKIERSK
jgi:flagellar motor switch protein FliG